MLLRDRFLKSKKDADEKRRLQELRDKELISKADVLKERIMGRRKTKKNVSRLAEAGMKLNTVYGSEGGQEWTTHRLDRVPFDAVAYSIRRLEGSREYRNLRVRVINEAGLASVWSTPLVCTRRKERNRQTKLH